jgi:deoxyribonuclease V
MLQEKLAEEVRLQPLNIKKFTAIAGVDVTAVRGDNRLWASVVLLDYNTMTLLEEVFAVAEGSFPYIPGLLSFRELPVVLKVFRKLSTIPDAVICDGQGLAHPRFFGLACHLGLWLNLPTVGCAKSRLVGDTDEVGWERGNWSPLKYKDQLVGSVLRTRNNVKPVYVSPGHLIDVDSARDLILACGRGRRLPEPTRCAHQAVTRFRKEDNA